MIKKYTNWLHTRWPAGTVEKMPEVREDGSTNLPGLYVVGDLTGIPLLKFSADTGARAVQTIVKDPSFSGRDKAGEGVLDLLIIGAGVSGMAAAMEARKQGLRFQVLEAAEPFSTIVNFPKQKPIYTYPTDMVPAGDLQFHEKSEIKEGLLEDLHEQVSAQAIEPLQQRAEKITRKGSLLEVTLAGAAPLTAHRVIVAIGRSGNFRKLGVPGEDLDKVYNRLHDPQDFCRKHVLVVGGGDSALETAIAVAQCGGQVTISYRKPEFSRPKPENVEKINALIADPHANVAVEHPSSERVTTSSGKFIKESGADGSVRLLMGSKVKSITEQEAVVQNAEGGEERLPNHAVFSMIGREAPLDFFRRSGVNIRGEWRPSTWLSFIGFFAFCIWMYHWKAAGFTQEWVNPAKWVAGLGGAWDNPKHLLGVLKSAYAQPWVYYTTAYALVVLIFGIRRIRRRKTPYITRQTLVLTAIQVFPLYLIPCIFLPWAYNNGWFDGPAGQWIMAEFFPGGPGDFWRAFGLILAWPLMAWNVFTHDPLIGWLIISFIQTFVIIPLIIFRWGKGAYCGWICSCGALAETLGDAHRQKMPHGPVWNRLNMVGQAVLVFSFVILLVRIIGWVFPASGFPQVFTFLSAKMPLLSFKYFVDVWLAGIIGVGMYFHFSGRVWCRFACPLAALMHIYTRFSRFRIVVEKKKCISCNVCTSVCHQGIDIMNFANKGIHMEDPECVRCSACVYACPTGVLTFGRVNPKTNQVMALDTLPASPVQMAERSAGSGK